MDPNQPTDNRGKSLLKNGSRYSSEDFPFFYGPQKTRWPLKTWLSKQDPSLLHEWAEVLDRTPTKRWG